MMAEGKREWVREQGQEAGWEVGRGRGQWGPAGARGGQAGAVWF